MDWKPERDLEIVAGTPPGGGLDRTARALAQAIEAHRLTDVPVHVKNIGGEGARKARAYMGTRAGDPHFVAISHTNVTTDYLMGLASAGHSASTPIAMLYSEYIAFIARTGSAIRTAAAFMSRARDARSITVALSTALGNPNHIAAAQVVRHAGGNALDLQVRVFDSALDAVDDVVAGHADIAAVTAASVLKALADGAIDVIAISAPERLAGALSDVPTWREAGVDCVIGAWRGVSGAIGIQAEHLAYWERLLASVRKTPEWQSALAAHGWTDAYVTGKSLARDLAKEHEDMAEGLRTLGLIER
jgi:putative tricarboxylic transport membrane protein